MAACTIPPGAKVVIGPAPMPLMPVRLVYDPGTDELSADGIMGMAYIKRFFTTYKADLIARFGPGGLSPGSRRKNRLYTEQPVQRAGSRLLSNHRPVDLPDRYPCLSSAWIMGSPQCLQRDIVSNSAQKPLRKLAAQRH